MSLHDTDKTLCRLLLDILEKKGVKDVVCSPGSRNAPLLIAAAAREGLHKHFCVDERSAAFMALGIASVTQQPVALICTSGTALLNYAPAVAEAYYQGVPLIVISADRPPQWIDQDDSQTIRQNDVLSGIVKASYSFPAYPDEGGETEWFASRMANDAMICACKGKPGPVHINVPLAEPLGKTITKQNTVPSLFNLIEGDSLGNKEELRYLAKELAQSRVLLVAGFMSPDDRLQKAITAFTKLPNVAVMAETLSNLHLDSQAYSVDSTLTASDSAELDRLSPDIVISIGGALVSRKLKEYLRKNSGKVKHWSVGYQHISADPFMSLSLRIELEPSRFFRNMSSLMKRMHICDNAKDFGKSWRSLKKNALKVKNDYVANAPWSELKAFEILLNSIPQEYNLFLSNGTAVRYAQIVEAPLPHAVYCNRGVSGIDGSVSTAIGGAIAFRGKTMLITGDLSMAYDIGALNITDVPDRFKIIVIDNQGGGIFRFIPSTSSLEEREEYFCQPPLLPLSHLAEGYGWDYFEADSEEKLLKEFARFLDTPRKSILKITCDGILSAEILMNHMNIKI